MFLPVSDARGGGGVWSAHKHGPQSFTKIDRTKSQTYMQITVNLFFLCVLCSFRMWEGNFVDNVPRITFDDKPTPDVRLLTAWDWAFLNRGALFSARVGAAHNSTIHHYKNFFFHDFRRVLHHPTSIISKTSNLPPLPTLGVERRAHHHLSIFLEFLRVVSGCTFLVFAVFDVCVRFMVINSGVVHLCSHSVLQCLMMWVLRGVYML